ncbi:SURF1 family protein [Rickettsiales bacterium Ac37b]|nr:SURF1 family protein [Rickettsiales bacterium Ac37b]
MNKIKLSPSVSFSIISCIIFFMLISLGSWQIYRLKWKLNVIQAIKTNLSMDTIGNKDLVFNNKAHLNYRKVKIQGKFLHNKELYLYAGNMSPNGKPGYFIVTPFAYETDKFILVNRGFIEAKQKIPTIRSDNTQNKEQIIEGILIPETRKPYFVPNNETKKNLLFWIKLQEISNYLGIVLYNAILLQYNSNEDELQPNKFSLHEIRNDHLAYAITWYSMAIAVLILYFKYKNNFKNKD